MHVTVKKTVPQSPEHVWSVLADHEGMTQWAPGLKASLTTVGTGDRNGVGAVRRISAPGPMPAIVEKIVKFEPGQHLGYDAVSGIPFRDYRGDVELRPAGSGTEILWSITVDPRLALVEKPALQVLARTLLTALVRRAKATV
jgi:carbon monoxide dehydrogenase subunit G